MDKEKLKRTLESVGKECFVKYFPLFKDRNLSNGEIAEIIKRERNYTDYACKTRTGHSRMIIDSGNAKEALKIIISSKKLVSSTVKLAEGHLKNLL
jgi:hypothetical protein